MLPRSLRLPLRQNFLSIKKEGRRIQSSFLTLLYVPFQGENSRFAFIISKKVSNKATVRNKMKRQLSQIVEETIPSFKNIYNIVFIAKPNIVNVDNNKLKEEIKNIFNHLEDPERSRRITL